MGHLDSAFGKMARADYHLDRLKRDVEAFFKRRPNPVRIEHAVKGVSHIARAHIVREIPQRDFATQIGDCVHNARAALDHLAWQLAELNQPIGNPSDDRRTQFPIFDKKPTFQKDVLDKLKAKKHGLPAPQGA